MFSALPDLGLASTFLATWMLPAWIGYAQIKGLTLAIMLEFLVLHGSMIAFALSGDSRRNRVRWRAASVFAGLYAVLGLTLCWFQQSLLPAVAFLWLLAGKFGLLWVAPVPGAERQRQLGYWVVGMGAYFIGALLTSMLPVPALGIDQAVRIGADLAGSGLWIEQPQVPLAFGAFYFACLGLAKLCWDGRLPGRSLPPARPRLP